MCVFCSIINHEIPSKVVYEDDQVLAILDISQVTKGHTLVMPKKHVDNLLECDDETAAHLIQVVKRLAETDSGKNRSSGDQYPEQQRRSRRPDCESSAFPHHSALQRKRCVRMRIQRIRKTGSG